MLRVLVAPRQPPTVGNCSSIPSSGLHGHCMNATCLLKVRLKTQNRTKKEKKSKWKEEEERRSNFPTVIWVGSSFPTVPKAGTTTVQTFTLIHT